ALPPLAQDRKPAYAIATQAKRRPMRRRGLRATDAQTGVVCQPLQPVEAERQGTTIRLQMGGSRFSMRRVRRTGSEESRAPQALLRCVPDGRLPSEKEAAS